MRTPGSHVAVAVLALLAGCAGTSPRTNFYTLSPEAQAPRPASAQAGTRVAITQVGIPEMVDRPQLVVRTAPNRVEIADFHRWAEPLRRGIARALADDLAAQLGPGFVVTAGESVGAAPDARVAVDVQRFEAVMGGGVTVDALWSVRPAKGEPRTGRSVIEERAQGGDHAAIAAAYSRALARVAQEISAAVGPGK
jgi:uncharacterized lipoprotein YmbA